MSAETRSRAAETLSVPVDAPSSATTSAFLAGLTATDFVPPGNCVAALNALVGLAIPNEAGSTPTLREEVEEFAGRYWTLTPADRLAAWLTLSTRGPDDATAERLLTLQAGLELPGTPLADSALEEIAAITRSLYVLPSRDRAIQRNKWLLVNAERHKELMAAAVAIQKNHAAVAVLEPDLFARLGPKFNAGLFADAATSLPLPKESHGAAKPIVYPPPRRRSPPAEPRSKIRGGGVYAAVVCFGLFTMFRILVSAGGSNSHQSPPKFNHQPKQESPQMVLPEEGNTSGSIYFFNQSQVEACLEHERDKSKLAPTCYVEWVLAGKPAAYEPRRRPPPRMMKGNPDTVLTPLPE